MSDDFVIDKRLARRAFERAAATYDEAAVLQHEVERRMSERLLYIRHAPQTILDAGSGTGGGHTLFARYPGARVLTLDIALPMLLQARAGARRSPAHDALPVCGDLESLPLRDAAFGLVWSNLALQWCNDLGRAFREVRRVLQPGGLFMFSTFGPDTLKELRAAYAQVDAHAHVNRFPDMHDIGDLLGSRGFAAPVMDVERITLTYAEVIEVMRDLKAIGAHNVTSGRPHALTGKTALRRVVQHYERFRDDGRLPATFEVVYGHAWKPGRAASDG